MATDSTLEMHRTHLRWTTDGDMWRDEWPLEGRSIGNRNRN